MKRDDGKSDWAVVPKKPPNKAEGTAAEAVEGRAQAKGNANEGNTIRMQSREGVPQALDRVGEAARRDRKQRFTALLHHVYDEGRLRAAYFATKRDAAAGVDGETWQHYGENLEGNLRELSGRLRQGAYRAKAVRRAYIPKGDGRLRPLGIPALEDKVVQRGMVEVMNAIYETEFLGFSYGFRPRRSQHQALDALAIGIRTKKVNWVVDADIGDFFGSLTHEWMVKFVEHRIGDKRIVRLIRKWLTAGVLVDGKVEHSERGTVQGGSISPLLANIYLHYVLDQWVQRWRKQEMYGEMIVVRYADDFVLGFQHRKEAERFQAALRARLGKFGLELHPEKTRLIEFGRFAAEDRRRRGESKPETFNFLGFTHICGKTKTGRFVVLRQTMRQRQQAKLTAVKAELKRRLHDPVPEVGAYLRAVVLGHNRYYGVPDNRAALSAFRHAVRWLWGRALRRRSQNNHVTWSRLSRLSERWLPRPRICHPYPDKRYAVTTRGKSRMR